MSAAHARVALDGDGEQPFARRYAHAGMVRLDGEKMSKSRGNLVFVSKLLAAGHDPMAIRLAIISHRYRSDWDWTDDSLAAATKRLSAWRAAVAATSSACRASAAAAGDTGGGEAVLARVRERMADDLDAPGAIEAVDAWAGAAAGGDGSGPLVCDTVDALLGIRL